MCGFSIEFSKGIVYPGKIKHRGLKRTGKKILTPRGMYSVNHYKLPFQTDLNDDWNQPVRLSSGNYLLFNGEIFNIPRIYQNDVEYLKVFFERENWLDNIGKEEYNSWDGFWSICIITREGVYAFTDPLGKKQLYFNEHGISSEIKPLLSPDAALEKEFNYSVPERTELTPFEGVLRITPNQLFFFPVEDRFQCIIKKRRLFDLSRKPKSDLKYLIKKAVLDRVHTKGLNTVFVSGGLDSTIILSCIMNGPYEKDLFEFITVDNHEDSQYISILESYYGIHIKRISIDEWKSLNSSYKEEILKAYEYPIEKGSLYPNYVLCKEASGQSIITGDGADELFSGYSRAQKSDTQIFDVFTELPYYHNIRLDRMGMIQTKEVRCPFQSHEVVRYALNTPYADRIGKKQLKDLFQDDIPQEILNRPKMPLRISDRRESESDYDKEIYNNFKNAFK